MRRQLENLLKLFKPLDFRKKKKIFSQTLTSVQIPDFVTDDSFIKLFAMQISEKITPRKETVTMTVTELGSNKIAVQGRAEKIKLF